MGTTTVAQAIEGAREAAAAQNGPVVLQLTLASGERLTILVRPHGKTMLVEGK